MYSADLKETRQMDRSMIKGLIIMCSIISACGIIVVIIVLVTLFSDKK
ncbi:hypothetical protein [Clostridium sp.]|jgi:hypothetical protein|nr:hypothetical protein [Clostridium sp.]MCI1800124.1 hypothetical protein [Clostridium sp.]